MAEEKDELFIPRAQKTRDNNYGISEARKKEIQIEASRLVKFIIDLTEKAEREGW